ncbi:MAG: pantetheine-phosphate adenylyltransferase [Fimbriimonas sp.]
MHRLAIYPGTFDPPTLGHLDLIERASRLFDHLIVAVGVNSSKKPLLSADDRVLALQQSAAHVPNVTVESFDGLLVEHAKRRGARSVVRGLRAIADFEYEFQIAMVNRRLADDVESVFLMTHWDYTYLSSSIVKEVALLGGAFESMVPPPVVPILQEAIRLRKSQA